MTDRPRVVFEDSTKQAVVDDWKAFVRDRLAPLPVVCPTCNGVVQVESHRHLFARKGYTDDGIGDVPKELVDRIVHGAAEQMATDRFWNVVMSQSPAMYHALRGDNRVLAEYFDSSKWDSKKLDTIAATIGRQLLPRDGEIGLYTYCPNCNQYIDAELPDFMRNDAKHELMRRVYAVHQLDYSWRKPEDVLPKEAQPLPKALSTADYEKLISTGPKKKGKQPWTMLDTGMALMGIAGAGFFVWMVVVIAMEIIR